MTLIAGIAVIALLLTGCKGSDSYKAGFNAGQSGEIGGSRCSDLASIASAINKNIDAGDFTNGCQDGAGK